MTKEEKQLLLKDLCARLPYGVICYWITGGELTSNITEYNGQLTSINKVEIEDSSDYYYDCYFNVCNDSNGNSFRNENVPVEIVKPYLRPMSSMTEEEKEELLNLLFDKEAKYFYIDEEGLIDGKTSYLMKEGLNYPAFCPINIVLYTDWLNAHHFDYRGFIEKGLALEAEEGMYNLKEK
jgi:hypothetical protein